MPFNIKYIFVNILTCEKIYPSLPQKKVNEYNPSLPKSTINVGPIKGYVRGSYIGTIQYKKHSAKKKLALNGGSFNSN